MHDRLQPVDSGKIRHPAVFDLAPLSSLEFDTIRHGPATSVPEGIGDVDGVVQVGGEHGSCQTVRVTRQIIVILYFHVIKIS